MKRKGEVEELVRRIVELEALVKAEANSAKWARTYADRRFAENTGERRILRKQLRQAQQDNARLQAKLQRRSRELGVQRAEVKKIDAMFCTAAEESEELLTALGQRRVEDDATITRLLVQVNVLWKLASVHFSADEIHRAMDEKTQVSA